MLTATRMIAIPMVSIYFIKEYIIEKNKISVNNLAKTIVLSFIGCMGYISFLIFIKLKFNTPLLDPLKINQAWGVSSPSVEGFFRQITSAIPIPQNLFSNPTGLGTLLVIVCFSYSIYIIFSCFFKINNIKTSELYLAIISLINLIGPINLLFSLGESSSGRYSLPSYALLVIIFACRLDRSKKLESNTAYISFLSLYASISAVTMFINAYRVFFHMPPY